MSKGSVEVLGDRVLLRLHPPKTEKGGIVIPDVVKEDANTMRQATVICVGEDAGNELKEGDTVLVPLGAGLDIEFDEDIKPTGKYKIIRAVDIMARIDA